MGEVHSSGRRVNRLARRKVIALALAALALLVVAATALAATGDISQPSGPAGCISNTGAGNCADGHGLVGPVAVAVSPDRKNVYVASRDSDLSGGDQSSVARFNLNRGELSQPPGAAGCISNTGAGPCADGRALQRSVLGGGEPRRQECLRRSGNGVARFIRNPNTGALSQPAGAAGCVSELGSGPEPCADGRGLGFPEANGLTVSPDGKSVYVASWSATTWRASTATRPPGRSASPPGAAGCINEDGSQGCADGHALDFPTGVAVSPDGRSVYVASLFSDAVVRLNRNTTTGAISQPPGTAGCVSEEGAGPCADGHALDGRGRWWSAPTERTSTPPPTESDAVVRLDRNTTTGAIVQPTRQCVSESGAGNCVDGDGLNGATGIAMSHGWEEHLRRLSESEAVARIDRRTTDGSITQPVNGVRCVSENGSGACADGHGLAADPVVRGRRAGRVRVYVASGGSLWCASTGCPRTPDPAWAAGPRRRHTLGRAGAGRLFP